MSDEPKKIHYELSTEAISSLQEVLPTQQWYKDSPKQGKLIIRANNAVNALPDTPDRPLPKKDETKTEYNKRVDVWGEPIREFEWTDSEKDAAKSCVQFYLKQGSFPVTDHTVAVLKLLGLDTDD